MNGSAIVGSLISVNVGQPREIQWRGKTYRTSIWKSPVKGKVKVSRLNVAGDGQADLVGHGGEQRAVFVYQMDSYRHWSTFLNRDDLAPGQFGENFTVEGLCDAKVCIGDRFSIGTAIFEVSAPRVTCFKVGIRMDRPWSGVRELVVTATEQASDGVAECRNRRHTGLSDAPRERWIRTTAVVDTRRP
jgi:MOSC domain-containing protein YiiM